ncbi:hypothetical protein NA66_1002446 [Burkholderia pyrrocinia]|uniref:Uncharacterized protein n=1 Tax=Burkholderia pyrrocinia TaxID=60550 RepID=A0A318IV50_BURPY|nr:hypothetical protein NA66_1002446 [Burkholderia pyrrocinia]SFW19130.1 hypothetical protein SAMN03159384_00513 [Burkholderia sp. NFACC33-1]SFX15624.1 hypothetical protein SAMN03159408_00514 [Burkholderia sp. NFPP32]
MDRLQPSDVAALRKYEIELTPIQQVTHYVPVMRPEKIGVLSKFSDIVLVASRPKEFRIQTLETFEGKVEILMRLNSQKIGKCSYGPAGIFHYFFVAKK